MQIKLGLYYSVALAMIFFYLGSIIKNRIYFLRKFCIPTPVIGGILFSFLNLGCHESGILSISLDTVFQNLCMVAFFTSIGYAASFKVIKSAGKKVVILTVITAVLICLQNVIGGYAAQMLGLSKLLGLTLGSIPLVGGHGNAGAFGPQIENMGISGAATVAMAAATFGLILGSTLGGSVANFLISRYHLDTPGTRKETTEVLMEGEGGLNIIQRTEKEFISNMMLAGFHIMLSMAAGLFLNQFIQKNFHLTVPVFLCSMCVAVVIRNVSEYTHTFDTKDQEGNIIGSIALNIFLALAMMSVKLWQLKSLALPMTIILLIQVVVTVLFISTITFHALGKNYESATMCAAQVGYGFGATPNAMANIAAVEEKYGPAPEAKLVIPFVGGLFTSLLNATLITVFINLFS